MTTEQIRKKIKVDNWRFDQAGIYISYTYFNSKKNIWVSTGLELGKEEVCQELSKLGEINYYGENDIEWENDRWDWYAFSEEWIFSQWDALNLVIRHEYNKSVEEDVNNGDIGKAVNNLLKK